VAATEPGAVWASLAWGMSRDETRAALARVGLTATESKPTKAPRGWWEVRHGGAHATLYFDETSDGLSQIVVTAEALTEAVAVATRERIAAHLGVPAASASWTEQAWQRGPLSVLLDLFAVGADRGYYQNLQQAPRFVSQDRRDPTRAIDPGPVGWGGLDWGMPSAEVARVLGQSGLTLQAQPTSNLPGRQHNPNPNLRQTPPTETARFALGEQRGELGVAPDVGLTRVAVAVRGLPDAAAGQARARELESQHGPADRFEDSTQAVWGTALTRARLTVTHDRKTGHWRLLEAYEPPDPQTAPRLDVASWCPGLCGPAD